MKKLLVLGGTLMQIPVIEYAKKCGVYVITADYLPDNPGHKISNEYHNVSTTDKQAVLDLSIELGIDGILAYASDPAAPTAAFVSEHMGLPGNPFSVVDMMSNKTLFRQLLKDNGFPVPHFVHFKDYYQFEDYLKGVNLPVIVKPIDSSGSKGITKVESLESLDLKKVYDYAMEFSRAKEIIVEDYIVGNQVHGDAFVYDGKVVFSYLGDQRFDGSIGKLVPCYTTFPSIHSNDVMENIESQLQKFISISGLKFGGLNVEVRVSENDGIPYIIEVGPRNGGHFTPDVIKYASGFDFAKASVDAALGLPFQMPKVEKKGFYTNLILHSKERGIYKDIEISNELMKHVIEKHIYKHPGDDIYPYCGSNTAIGVLVLGFDSRDEIKWFTENQYNYYKILFQ